MSSKFFSPVALAFFAAFFASAAHAEIVETKFKVTGGYYDDLGNVKKFVKTRAFVRYDTDAGIFSDSAKSNCQVTSGKQDALSVWTKEDSYECISNKTFVITDEDAIVDMFYRSAGFSFLSTLFSDKTLVDRVYDLESGDGTIENRTMKDEGRGGAIRALIRKLLSQASQTQTISLVGPTTFELKGKGNAKCVIQLEPVKTKAL